LGASAFINKIALVKKKGNKVDKSSITCYYCQKIRHKSNECHKKKKDAEEKVKKVKVKGSGAQITKSVNVHVNTTTIEEIDNNNDIPISLYAAT
jgi:hypothetical protein